ncbi:MAG: PHB depolymerase family esterase, partial [Planctomycetota bacterium]
MNARVLIGSSLLFVIVLIGWSGVRRVRGQERLNQAFERVDENEDGRLSSQEINRFGQLTNRLKDADQDGDQLVSKIEFRSAILRGVKPITPSTGTIKVGDSLREVQSGELQRRYRIHVPVSYDGTEATPVVIAFHGGGGNPESMILLSGLNEKSDEAGFIVVYPYGSGRQSDRGLTFNGGECCGYAMNRDVDDVGFVDAILDDLQSVANIDPDRIYATGISNGGIMTYLVASELSDRIAAIAPVGGPMMTDDCHPTRPVSVMHFHGTGDELAPFGGGKGKGSPGIPAFLRPEFRSVEFTMQNWIHANGCNPEPTIEQLPDIADDGMRVTRKTWSGGRQESEVVLLEIKNGGHTWPGR